MTMRLNVPFIPETAYAAFLDGLGGRLHSVHFSLYDPGLNDARIRLQTREMEALVAGLQALPQPKKYLLANARFQAATLYGTARGTTGLVAQLALLKEAGVLDGIVFADPYLLMALSDKAPELVASLEAVPSINFMIDSVAKLEAALAAINASRFLPPSKLPLDRSLNRSPAALGVVAAAARARLPGIQIELLANEGCLDHCPFRASHEAHIAAANLGHRIDTFRLNQDLGCMRLLSEAPHRILASPFIRPEEVSRYAGLADIVKICGRTLGRTFLVRTIQAYTAEAYAGNLLDLLDAANWMAASWNLPNQDLPADLGKQLAACASDCAACTVCRDIFRRSARRRPLHLKRIAAGDCDA
jgi:collagenase-like PrtC family protease